MREAERAAPREAAFLRRALKLRRGSRVLDVCCGTGRHAVPLAKRGALVTGVDATPSYLSQVPRTRGLTVRSADMRRLPFRGEFDAAYNVWTSFGYFEDPAEDVRVLQSIARALKPGGLFLIDVLDFAWLKKNFEPERCERQEDGSWRFERSRLRQGADPALVSEWMILRLGRPPATAPLFVRGYDEARLRLTLERAGLTPLKRWRSLTGGRSGVRLVMLSCKQGGQP